MGIFSGKIEYFPKWVNLSGTLTQWYIFEKTSHLFLLGKFGPKIWCSPNYLKFKTVIHCRFWHLLFQFFIHSIFLGKCRPKIESSLNELNLVQTYTVLCGFWFWHLSFQSFCRLNFFGQIWAQNLNWTKLDTIVAGWIFLYDKWSEIWSNDTVTLSDLNPI